MNAKYALTATLWLLFGIFHLEATVAQEVPLQASDLNETYVNKEKNYSLNYPSDWQKKEVKALDLVLFSPPKNPIAPPHASMNVVSEQLEAPVTLEQFYSESISNLTADLQDVQIEKQGERLINAIPSKWILYSHVMQGTKFLVLQYFLVNKKQVYLMTFSSLADEFEKYRPIYDRMAATFRLIENKNATNVPQKNGNGSK